MPRVAIAIWNDQRRNASKQKRKECRIDTDSCSQMGSTERPPPPTPFEIQHVTGKKVLHVESTKSTSRVSLCIIGVPRMTQAYSRIHVRASWVPLVRTQHILRRPVFVQTQRMHIYLHKWTRSAPTLRHPARANHHIWPSSHKNTCYTATGLTRTRNFFILPIRHGHDGLASRSQNPADLLENRQRLVQVIHLHVQRHGTSSHKTTARFATTCCHLFTRHVSQIKTRRVHCFTHPCGVAVISNVAVDVSFAQKDDL